MVKITKSEGLKYEFPKDRQIDLIDFHNSKPEEAIDMFRESIKEGNFCVTSKSSYEGFLEKLDKRTKEIWEKESGELCVTEDMFK
jgi:hypothetical protein